MSLFTTNLNGWRDADFAEEIASVGDVTIHRITRIDVDYVAYDANGKEFLDNWDLKGTMPLKAMRAKVQAKIEKEAKS
tara:strand:+ start:507 stop:740 length:234 start_codon:yes stop_codon:yes gene_type:complete